MPTMRTIVVRRAEEPASKHRSLRKEKLAIQVNTSKAYGDPQKREMARRSPPQP